MNNPLGTLAHLDPEHMFEAVQQFPRHLREGRQRADVADLSKLTRHAFNGAVVAGMGGSAIGGDLLATLAAPHARVTTCRAYELPGWVDRHTVVIACSYSGNTEETLMLYSEAVQRGASLVCITTGGALAAAATQAQLPLMQLPAGLQPRAALGHSLTALLRVGEHLGMVHIEQADWQEAFTIAERQAREFAAPDNRALAMARKLVPLFPVMYSSQRLEAVNVRWRTQMHENAKKYAVGNMLPEMNHNEIMGWDRRGEELRRLGVIMLSDSNDHERTRMRMEITQNLLQELAGGWMVVESEGKGPLARLLSLLYPADWVSLYLALLRGVDPSPVGLIAQLKAELERQ